MDSSAPPGGPTPTSSSKVPVTHNADSSQPSPSPPQQPSSVASQPEPPTGAAAETATAASDEPPPPAPGPRAARLSQVFEQSLEHTLSKMTYDNFSACFPTVAARNPSLLRAVQSQMVEQLRRLCRREFDRVMRARRVVPRLNELEGLLEDAAARRSQGGAATATAKHGAGERIVPHTLPPETILAAHLIPHLLQHQSQLNARLQTVQSKNAVLWSEILNQRAEMASLLVALNEAVGDLDGAVQLLAPVVDELGEETRLIEADMD